MAMSLKSVHFFALFFIVVLLANQEMPVAEAKLCQKRSKTWTGPCIKTKNCDHQCRKWEKAQHGACHWQWPGFACFCYVNC
ncbi:Defensin-like protein, putative [Theobroma cacao]|uniref:Defensin-like protein, putative n=1 Tax=Theobroma cacao TaxID=3641 RepID=A0A061E6R0_THECC|nr:Defensin-like protein, putative [Theobroma cacao]